MSDNKITNNLIEGNITTFNKDQHIKYLVNVLESENKKMFSLENSKMMLFYFIIAGLDILDGLSYLTLQKSALIDWIYSQQCFTEEFGGFRGGPYLGIEFHKSDPNLKVSSTILLDKGHLVHTYSAITSLKILGDDFSRLRKKHIFDYLRKCQNEDGSFKATIDSYESDLRFLYAACAICCLMNDFSAIDINLSLNFIYKCQNNDGAFGLRPNEESHSGATYCAIASLALLKQIDDIPIKTKLIEFLVNRQVPWNLNREKGCVGGFQGRINKYPDSCYSFWNGASLKILGYDKFINKDTVKAYILNCQDIEKGGFKKFDFNKNPDPIHTLHSIYGLSLLKFDNLPEIDPLLGITKQSSKNL